MQNNNLDNHLDINLNLLKKERFKILNSNLKKDFLFIDDFIDAIFLSIKNKKLFGKIVNVGSGKSVSLNYLGKKIQSIIKQGKVIFKNTKKTKSLSQFSSINLIKKTSLKWLTVAMPFLEKERD